MIKSRKAQSGYSLIEILVVATIMVLLTGIGASIYSQTRHVEQVNNGAHDIQGLIMEAQSKARGAQNLDVLGYQVLFDQAENKVSINRLDYTGALNVNDIGPGDVDESDFRTEEIRSIELGEQIKIVDLGLYSTSGRVDNLNSVSAISKSGRMTYNGGREPYLGQSDNIYSPFEVNPISNGVDQARITLAYDSDQKNFSKSVIIYLKTGQVEVVNLD